MGTSKAGQRALLELEKKPQDRGVEIQAKPQPEGELDQKDPVRGLPALEGQETNAY